MNSIPVAYTKADVFKAFDLHFAKKFPIRSRLMLILGVPILAASLVLFLVSLEAYPKLKWIFLLMGIFYIGFYFYRKRVMVNLAMKNPTIAKMGAMKIAKNHIRFSGDKGYNDQPWSSFIDCIEDNDSMLLYLSKQNFFILPKRCFSPEDLASVRASITRPNAK